MLLSLAWKNIWRKPTRSLVLIAAITIGLAGGVFAISLTEGMISQRNKEQINVNYGHIQIHNPAFLENMKMTDSIKEVTELTNDLRKDTTVKGISSRLKFFGLASTSRSNQGVMIFGVNPEDDKLVCDLNQHLIDTNSTYFGKGDDNEIIISSLMAQDLKIVDYIFTENVESQLKSKGLENAILDKISPLLNTKVRSKKAFKDSLKQYLSSVEFDKYSDVIVDFSSNYKLGRKIILRFNNANGIIVDEAFKVTGVYETSNAMYDKLNVFVRKDYLAKLAGVSPNVATEIVIKLNDIEKVDKLSTQLGNKYNGLKIESYKQLDPFMLTQGEFVHLYYYVIIGFILFSLSFGIINTVLMSVMERTKELGMLMSVGMKRKKIFNLIMLESVLLSITGGIIGMIVGAVVSQFFHVHGLNMAEYAGTWEAYGFNSTIYPLVKFNFFILVTVFVIIAGILSAIYPARRALKLNPSDALRSDV